jgi:hypothetical protein
LRCWHCSRSHPYLHYRPPRSKLIAHLIVQLYNVPPIDPSTDRHSARHTLSSVCKHILDSHVPRHHFHPPLALRLSLPGRVFNKTHLLTFTIHHQPSTIVLFYSAPSRLLHQLTTNRLVILNADRAASLPRLPRQMERFPRCLEHYQP